MSVYTNFLLISFFSETKFIINSFWNHREGELLKDKLGHIRENGVRASNHNFYFYTYCILLMISFAEKPTPIKVAMSEMNFMLISVWHLKTCNSLKFKRLYQSQKFYCIIKYIYMYRVSKKKSLCLLFWSKISRYAKNS